MQILYNKSSQNNVLGPSDTTNTDVSLYSKSLGAGHSGKTEFLTNLTQHPIIQIFRTVQHSLVMLPQGLSLAPGCMSRFCSPFTSNEGIPPDREKREEQHRAQTIHSPNAPPPNGHANSKPKTGKIAWPPSSPHVPSQIREVWGTRRLRPRRRTR